MEEMRSCDFSKYNPFNTGNVHYDPEQFEKSKIENYNRLRIEDETGIECSLCGNKRYILFWDEETKQRRSRDCACRAKRVSIERLQKQNLLIRVSSDTFEDFNAVEPYQKTMLDTAEKYVSEERPMWLMLCGQTGTGKTHLCNAVFLQMCFGRCWDGRYFEWNRDSRQVKSKAISGDETVFDGYKTCDLLYIDDLFKTKDGIDPTDADIRLAFELLNHRYNNRLPTIISSEKSIDEIMRLDEAGAGRIKEMCGEYLVSIARDSKKNYRIYGNCDTRKK